MRKIVQFTGVVLFLQGASGAVDHLVGQPFLGVFLNFFNRVLFPLLHLPDDRRLFAHLVLVVLGIALVVAARRIPER